MTKSNVTLVPAARVRKAFAEGLFTAPDEAMPSLMGGTYSKSNGYVASESGLVRGRLHPLAVQAFNEQVKGERYGGEKSPVEGAREVTVPMFSAKTGRPVKPVTKTVEEVRKAAGIVGKKGRISQADMLKAAVAFGSGQPKAPAAPKAKAKAKTTKAPAKAKTVKATPEAPKATAEKPTA